MKYMNFEEFVNKVTNRLEEYLPEELKGADVVVRTHQKLNENYLGLTLQLEGKNAFPIVNLEDYFQDYEQGRSIHNIMGAIAETLKMEMPQFDLKSMIDFESAKKLLFIRVNNLESNAEYLKNLPYTVVEDMAITYHLAVTVDEHGVSSAPVTNDILKSYGVDKEELHQAALENSANLFPVNTCSLNEMMKNLMVEQFREMDMPEEMMEEMLEEFQTAEENPMTVVTNDVKINGAAVIFYPEVMDELAKQIGGDYFILPSSVNEVLILPDNGSLSAQELKEMVTSINATEVAPNERLTDQVYHYDPIDRVFEKASSFETRVREKMEAEKNAKKASIMEKLGEKKEVAKEMQKDVSAPARTTIAAL